MAGMLPGVECARRRRFHRSGGGSDTPIIASHAGGTRRPSFCFYSGNHETNHCSISSMRRISGQENQSETLGGVAREAKERLDERLRSRRQSETKRERVDLGRRQGRCMGTKELQMEVFGLKKKRSKKFNWGKLSWKAMDQEECAVCLDEFKAGETLVHLPCAHMFHSGCLVPWLENNCHCPCCRMDI